MIASQQGAEGAVLVPETAGFLGNHTDIASLDRLSTTCEGHEETGLDLRLPAWTGPDLRQSDPAWARYAARAHARELLAAYDVAFDRHGKVYVDMLGRVRRPVRRVPYRGRWCGVRMVRKVDGVQVYQRPDRDLGRVGGVCNCGGSMTCPVCAPRISARRAGEIMEAASVAALHGLPTTMETYTLTHEAGNILADEVDVWKEAFRLAFSGKHSNEARKNRLGYINAAEVTYGRNGWHFHRHLLTIWNKEPDVGPLEDCWRSAARHVGRYTPAFEGHAFNSRRIEGCEEYLSKIGWELSNPAAKDSRTPFRLLIEDMEGDREAGCLYIEAVVAMTQHKVGSVRWSPRTRAKLGLATEKSDDELATEEATQTDVLLGVLSEGQWARIVDQRLEYRLLAVAQEGERAVNEFLGEYGIHRMKRPDRWEPAAAPAKQDQALLEFIRL